MNLAEKQASSHIDLRGTGAGSNSLSLATAIVGLGHPLRGDDGAGNAVVNALAQTRDLPGNINLLEGGTEALFDADIK